MATTTPKVNTPVVQAKAQEVVKSDLGSVEAQKVREANDKRIASQDAARIRSGSRFPAPPAPRRSARPTSATPSHSPIPIPDDEQDEEVWTQERLDSAQENLMMASAQFAEAARSPEAGGSLAEALVGSSFLPIESDTAGLQALADREPPPPVALEDVTTDVKQLFNIELKDEVPLGHKVLATGLVVAGEAGCVQVDQDGLNEQKPQPTVYRK